MDSDARFIFEVVETVADGLGPTYNAQSCRERHQNIVTGEARIGRFGWKNPSLRPPAEDSKVGCCVTPGIYWRA